MVDPGQPSADRFRPIGDYAAIGDGHTVALIGSNGSVDWLPLPAFSDPSVFAALLDPDRGGRFRLAPAVPHEAERRYLPDTNVLETTHTTADGTLRVTDAMNLGAVGLLPGSELVRRIEGVSGSVPIRWELEPRFEYGQADPQMQWRGGHPVACHGDSYLATMAFDAGEPRVTASGVEGATTIEAGDRALLAAISAERSPLMFPDRDDLEARFDQTIELWRSWVGGASYDGPWNEAVKRSLLALKLLVYEPTGAIVAAPTTSLPESVGGGRNFDYRFAWVRDMTFALNAVLRTGMREQAHRSFAWLLKATAHTHPRLQPFYRLDGYPPRGQESVELAGYRGSRPVRHGNAASGQSQLGNYGDVLDTAYLYVDSGATLDRRSAQRLAELADLVCEIWPNADSGIWELRDKRQYTHSKIACWVALNRALELAERGELPDAHAGRWRRSAGEIRRFVEGRCWSESRAAFVRDAGSEELDAATMLAARMQFVDAGDERMRRTIETIRRELGVDGGPLLYRYSGMREKEGAFLACSFWMAEAYARSGELDESAAVIEATLAHANDLGLMAEEYDPGSGELRGNYPQGLSHLAFLNAAALHTGESR